MKCGYSKKITNPPIGIPIAGSFDARYSKGLIDDFHARAVAFSDGQNTAILISVDICHLKTETQDRCRARIAEKTGVDIDSVIIGCTHTHAGPETYVHSRIVEADPNNKTIIENYTAFLCDMIVESAIGAVEDLKPARIYTSTGKAERIANVRRYKMKDGTTITNPGRHNPNIDYPLGKPNETVRFLKIEREGAKDVFIVNYGMHATTVHGRTYLSADYPGVVCSTLEKALDAECMFFQSAQGDIVQINALPSPEIAALNDRDGLNLSQNKLVAVYSGHTIAGAVLKEHMLAKEINADKLVFKKSTVKVPSNKSGGDFEDALKICELHECGRHFELPYTGMALATVVANARRIVEMKDEPDFYEYNVHTILLGDFAFACLPGEPFTEIRNRIDESSPIENVMVCVITNCTSTYFPTTKAFSEGGYEVATTRIGPGTDDIIVNTVINDLTELKNNK